jgi:hypothetical protein
VLPLGGFFSCYGDESYLVTRVLSCMLLELVRKICIYVSYPFLFHGYYWLDPWGNIRAYTLHQISSLMFVEKTIAKVARRSKRVYNLLDIPC